MNRQFVQGIVDSLSQTVGADKERISLALSIGIAYSLGLPPSGSEAPADYYTQNFQFKVQQFVAEFNERFLLDVSMVIAGVKSIWMSRYNQIHLKNVGQVSEPIKGESPVRKFVTKFEVTDQDVNVIAQAALLVSDRVQEEMKKTATLDV